MAREPSTPPARPRRARRHAGPDLGAVSPPGVPPRGRGAVGNPLNRFERLDVELEVPPPDRVPTLVLRDTSRSVIARNDSPDVPFDASLNPYRGCEHGCAYCYARPSHEYLGFSAGLDFESRILVKEDAAGAAAPRALAPRWQPQTLRSVRRHRSLPAGRAPARRHPALPRGAGRVPQPGGRHHQEPPGHARRRPPRPSWRRSARRAVALSVTTLDVELARKLEPRAAAPKERLRAIAELAAAGIPVTVMVAPVIPGLTDHEMPRILAAAAAAGASSAGYVPLRLPGAVAGLFDGWLAAHFPDRRDKVLNRIRAMRGGRLNDPRFGNRMRGDGVFADQHAHPLPHRPPPRRPRPPRRPPSPPPPSAARESTSSPCSAERRVRERQRCRVSCCRAEGWTRRPATHSRRTSGPTCRRCVATTAGSRAGCAGGCGRGR